MIQEDLLDPAERFMLRCFTVFSLLAILVIIVIGISMTSR